MPAAAISADAFRARCDAVSAGLRALSAAVGEAAIQAARPPLRTAIDQLADARLPTATATSTQRRQDAPLKQRRLDLLEQAERAMAASHRRLSQAA